MNLIEQRKRQEAEWCMTHRLSPEQFQKLLADKLSRAHQMHLALKQREALTRRR